ncbi:S8 family serine peptidase [Kitasatospora sp. YST-16]|uniref:S8 family serine peptidase n=1 Tax=Kitasatospora sp. YST-16 TaxID=2998080 RepID=UPI002284CA91|nr:S8 family serine peptidase [Kitasatospora sp. YST-16]WAL71989.1 S8 family serine peptidase [Kitasatospora sp. YST-16]WNW38036.1 S8 family serine peptidase [Streptomyces sp. Li-HN-5-13]
MLFSGAPVASADQVRDGQWVNSYFNLDKVWAVSKGDGVIVAVIDSGVDASHPDLAGSVLPGYDPGGQGLNTNPTDDHGTSIAGIIAAHGHGSGDGVVGLAPSAKILPIYKGKADGTSALPEDIKWAVDHGAKVINLSLGSDAKAGSRSALTEAVAYAAKNDVLIVGAAGNESLKTVDSPGNEPGVLAVSAVDKSGAIWPRANSGPEVKIAAPGVDIVIACAGGKYCIGDGTSEATAYVSGAAALLRAKYPELTAGQVASRLVKTVQVPASLQGAKVPDSRYGYGILALYEALTKDIPAGPPQGPLGGAFGATSEPSSTSSAAAGGAGASPAGTLPPLHSVSGGSSASSGVGTGALVAVVGGAVVLVVVIVIVVAASRRRAASVPPPGHPPYGAAPRWPPAPQQYSGQGQPMPPQPYGNQAAPPQYPPQQNPYN